MGTNLVQGIGMPPFGIPDEVAKLYIAADKTEGEERVPIPGMPGAWIGKGCITAPIGASEPTDRLHVYTPDNLLGGPDEPMMVPLASILLGREDEVEIEKLHWANIGVCTTTPQYRVEVSTGTRTVAWKKSGEGVEFAEDITLDEAKRVIVNLIDLLEEYALPRVP